MLQEEIFGPLLAVERVRDVEDACDRVDASPFGLTGGLFARNPETVDRVIERTPVGNLYVNRAITGAMVARQPFGGRPASSSARVRMAAQPGACSAGLSTTALPVARPAAVMPQGMATGKFHGEMTATTPRGR